MKNTIIILIVATTITLAGCGKKRTATNNSTPSNSTSPVRTNYSLFYSESDAEASMQMKVNQCQVIGYAKADITDPTDIVLTVSEIWKGINEAAALGITNGLKFDPRSSKMFGESALDGGIFLVPTVYYERGVRQTLTPSEAFEKRLVLPVRDGKFSGMTVKEYKDKYGL